MPTYSTKSFGISAVFGNCGRTLAHPNDPSDYDPKARAIVGAHHSRTKLRQTRSRESSRLMSRCVGRPPRGRSGRSRLSPESVGISSGILPTEYEFQLF